MTEEIIKSITVAEAEAEEIKAEALAKAAAIVKGAEEEVSKKERAAEENRKAYREERLKNAVLEAETEYEKTVAKKLQEAKTYCEDALRTSEDYIGEIVRRIISGDC